MKSRLLASLSVSAAVILGASGCAMVSSQATTIPYSPSDGVNVPDSGPLEVRNALIVANESGSLGNLIAAVVNTTDEQQTLLVTVGSVSETLRVPASTTISLGVDEDALLIDPLDSIPGSTVDVIFASGDATGVLQPVPVLDGALPYYEEFVPTESAAD